MVTVASLVIRAPISPRFEASGVWTGSEAIVWGGVDDSGSERLLSDGAAYDPETDRWRVIHRGPLTERSGHLAVWTGSEMLIWGGHRANYIEPPDGAAYDPETDRWREIADGPLGWEPNAAGAWTGSEWVVAVTDGRAERTDFAAYDPASNEWRTLPSVEAPFGDEKHLTWAGNELILLDQSARLSRLPSDADEWIAAAPLPGGFPVYPTVEWTGEHVIGIASQFLGTDQPRYWQFLVGWDPNSDAWPSLPAAPDNLISADHLVWADGRAIALGSDLAYDAASNAWWDLPTPTWDDRYNGVVLWANDRLFVWGGGERDEVPAAFEDGMVLTPNW